MTPEKSRENPTDSAPMSAVISCSARILLQSGLPNLSRSPIEPAHPPSRCIRRHKTRGRDDDQEILTQVDRPPRGRPRDIVARCSRLRRLGSFHLIDRVEWTRRAPGLFASDTVVEDWTHRLWRNGDGRHRSGQRRCHGVRPQQGGCCLWRRRDVPGERRRFRRRPSTVLLGRVPGLERALRGPTTDNLRWSTPVQADCWGTPSHLSGNRPIWLGSISSILGDGVLAHSPRRQRSRRRDRRIRHGAVRDPSGGLDLDIERFYCCLVEVGQLEIRDPAPVGPAIWSTD